MCHGGQAHTLHGPSYSARSCLHMHTTPQPLHSGAVVTVRCMQIITMNSISHLYITWVAPSVKEVSFSVVITSTFVTLEFSILRCQHPLCACTVAHCALYCYSVCCLPIRGMSASVVCSYNSALRTIPASLAPFTTRSVLPVDPLLGQRTRKCSACVCVLLSNERARVLSANQRERGADDVVAQVDMETFLAVRGSRSARKEREVSRYLN